MSSELAPAAATSQLQRASQHYLECRRKVTAKVEEVKSLEFEIQAIFERIAELQVTQNTNKSVGKLQVTIAAVEGEAPVEDALIHVDLDPEYVEDVASPAPVVEKKQDDEKEDGEQIEKEDGEEQAEEGEQVEATEKKEEEEGVQVEAPKAEKRVIAWNDAEAFPKTFVFDPVQSREAVVTITVAAKSNEDDDEEEEPVKEIEFPISKLFTETLDNWFVVVEAEKEEEEKTKEVVATTTTITEVVSETENGEVVTEVEEEVIEEVLAQDEDEHAEGEAAAAAAKPQAVRLHVKAALDLSPIEKLNLTAIALTKQKQEAEAILSVLEREVASLRSKYERITASQRAAASASTVSKQGQSGALLGMRGMGLGQPRAPKSRFERLKESISSTISKRQDNLISVGIFVGSVLLFHYNGENLLA